MLFALDSLSPLIVATVVGQVFPSDWRDGVAVLVTDPTMPRTACVLVDLRRADVAVSVEDVGWMAAVLHRLHARFAGRVALLTAAVGHATPAALLASYADGVRFRVQSFTDEPAARSWLAVGN